MEYIFTNVQSVLWKGALKISEISQENAFVGVSFW